MKTKLVLSQVGKLLIIIGCAMLLPLAVALYDKDSDVSAFLIGFFITTSVGVLLYTCLKTKGILHIRDGFALVTFGWLAASVFGCIPYAISGYFPTVLDAFFETLSGFTATGITVIDDVESLPKSILLWRSLSQWLGGMGIVVLFVALLSNLGTGGMQLFKAELTGPVKEKIRPRISDTAKSLWLIYMILTIADILALWLCGMNFFDAVNHGMTTVATGGYSTKTANFGYFESPLIQWVTIVFMFLSGLSFATVYRAFAKKSISVISKNSEIHLYVAMVVFFSTLITGDLLFKDSAPLFETIRLALFNVVSLITTTGFIIYDFENWSYFVQTILLFLMFTGACAGSTSGGIKLERLLILLKQTKNELLRILHPRLVTSLKINNTVLPSRVVSNVSIYIFLYFVILMVSTVIATAFGLPFIEAFSTSASCIGNGGPSFGMFGPTESFANLPGALKVYDCILMLIGRLEIYTVLVVVLPLGHKHGGRIDRIGSRQ